MGIQAWLGETPQKHFVEQYYGRLPFAMQQNGAAFCHLGSWETLGPILEDPQADVMVVKENRRSDDRPSNQEEALGVSSEGKTILVRHAEQHNEQLSELAQSFRHDFTGVVNIHMYATPAAARGFGWHYDAEEVFILQTKGCKEYSLRKNTVNPWPLEETLPADMQYERELMPLMRCTLRAGDWLYIPSGYWHQAQAQPPQAQTSQAQTSQAQTPAPTSGEPGAEAAISLAVGIMPPTAVDIYDALRHELLDSMLWRQRLPLSGAAAALTPQERASAMETMLDQLGQDLQRRLQDDRWRESILRKFNQGDKNQGQPTDQKTDGK